MNFFKTISHLFNKTALHIAVEKGNPEIVSLLLSCKDIDINREILIQLFCISFNLKLLIQFPIYYFHKILK